MGDTIVKPGDVLTITRSIFAKTGLPPGHLRQRDRTPGRQLILVNFDSAGLEHLLPVKSWRRVPALREPCCLKVP
jgi:hypothetical protein